MKITTAPFEAVHFYGMTLRTEDAADIEGADIHRLIKEWKATKSETAFVDGVPAFLFGSRLDKNGHGYLWAVSSPLADKCALYATKRTRARIQELFVEGARTVCAYCHKDNHRALRWLTKGLGMKLMGDYDASRYWLVVMPGESK